MDYTKSIAHSLDRIANFFDSIYRTEKGRVGTNDYGSFMNSKVSAILLKSILIELQKLNAQKQRVTA